MSAGLYSFKLEQGATFYRKLKWTDAAGNPKDLTGFTAKMQIRTIVTSPIVLVELSTSNGRITITPETGTIELYMDDATTQALSFDTAVYSLELTSPANFVTRLIEGYITFSLAVTI